MKIKLANGIELNPVMVTGGSRYIQGANRDVLSFLFPATEDIVALDAAFTESACETIVVTGEDGAEHVHKAYTIRTELKKEPVEVSPATAESDAVIEDRITVSMAKRTYAETQLAALYAMGIAYDIIVNGEG